MGYVQPAGKIRTPTGEPNSSEWKNGGRTLRAYGSDELAIYDIDMPGDHFCREMHIWGPQHKNGRSKATELL
jgi:hypothetical protein